MSTNHRFTLLIMSLVLLAMSFVVVAPRSAEALPDESCYCVCYDENWNFLGDRLVTCSGQVFQSGQNTGCAHRSCDCEPC